MIKALLIEDKSYIRKAFLSLLKLLDFDISVIGECESVKEATTVALACKPDLVFLDINLPDGNAFDFLKNTKDLSFKTIFITAHEEYALKALKFGAVDYLLKPLDIDDLEKALSKVIKTPIVTQKERIKNVSEILNDVPQKIILSLQDSLQVINLKDLMYCKSDKGYTTFFLKTGKNYMASKSLKEFETLLNKADFIRPHQSYMVNLNFINKYDKSGVIYLHDNQKIPVSSRKKDDFISKLLS